MAKKSIKKFIVILIILFVALVATSLTLKHFFSLPDKLDLGDKLMLHCEKNDTIKIQDITDFDWDIAYIDKQNYGVGEQILQKGIVGDFKALESDFLYRIAFCKDNTLVYDLILNEDFISIDNSIFEFTPQTTLHIKRSQENPERYLLSTKDWQD